MNTYDVMPPNIFAIYFSGFSPHAIEYKGVLYPTVEHAYHCLRYHDPAIIEKIRAARSPELAWELSQKYKPKRDALSDEEKLTLMESLFRAKLEQHADVRRELIASGLQTIEKRICTGPPGDSFWDIGEGNGSNHMGEIWMKLRAELLTR